MTALNTIQEAYANGLQAALKRPDLLATTNDETITEIRARMEGLTGPLKQIGFVDNTSLFKSVNNAFTSAYSDAAMMYKDKTEQYQALASLGEVEQAAFCHLLAYVWITTRQYLGLDFDQGLLIESSDRQTDTKLHVVSRNTEEDTAG